MKYECTCQGANATTIEADCLACTDPDVEVEVDEYGAIR